MSTNLPSRHLFQVDRGTGAMTAADDHEMGTSPSCLALNAAETRLYSANEKGITASVCRRLTRVPPQF